MRGNPRSKTETSGRQGGIDDLGQSFDDIERVPSAATLEETYRLVAGRREVCVTCVYRWPMSPAAEFLAQSASDLGQRLGRNTIVIPRSGHEEAFWEDAQQILIRAVERWPTTIEFLPLGVYLIISSGRPTTLEKGRRPFLLWDVSALSPSGFVFLFSRLLNLFNTEPGRNRYRGVSPGEKFLSGRYPSSDEGDYVNHVLTQLAELSCVLDETSLQLHNFRWPAQQKLERVAGSLRGDEETYAGIVQNRQRISSSNTGSGPRDRQENETILDRRIPEHPGSTWRDNLHWSELTKHVLAIVVGVVITVVGAAVLAWLGLN